MSCDFSTKFLIVLSILCACQVCVTVYSKAATTTFERRYGLPSTASATISLCYNAAGVVGLIFTGIYGNRMHKPKALGVGGILVAIGAFVAVLPQFLSEPYKQNKSENNAEWSLLCKGNDTINTCNESTESVSSWFFVLLIGEVIMGLGFSGFMTLGMSYLHDSVTPEKRGFYQGILLTIFIGGPLMAFGFILPSVSMLYVDFYRSDITMDRHDPEWVGAWWLGYIISGTMVLLISIPMFSFPRHPEGFDVEPEPETKTDFRLAYKMARTIFTCMVPTILIINHAIASIPTSALTTYGGKYLERQFGLSAHASAAYYGMVTILASMFGTFFGGWLHKRLKLEEKGSSVIVLVGCILSCTFVCPLFFLGCDTPDIIGLESMTNEVSVIQDICPGCVCQSNEIQLCQNDIGVTWASPCAAGCTIDNGTSQFSNCACSTGETISTRIKLCSDDYMYLVLACWALVCFTHGITGGPYISLLLSNIPKDTKVITFGLMHLLMKIIGYAPGPMIAGVLIDRTCLFWKYSSCGIRESCQLYSMSDYRRSFTYLMLIPGLIALPGFVAVYFKSKRKERCPMYLAGAESNERTHLKKSSNN